MSGIGLGTEAEALERWIADAFAQISAPGRSKIGGPHAKLSDRADESPECSAGADLAALGADRASPDVATFLDRTEAWLHGRPDALELLERLRARLAPREAPAGEGDPVPAGAEDAGQVEASAPQQPPEDDAADGSGPWPTGDST